MKKISAIFKETVLLAASIISPVTSSSKSNDDSSKVAGAWPFLLVAVIVLVFALLYLYEVVL